MKIVAAVVICLFNPLLEAMPIPELLLEQSNLSCKYVDIEEVYPAQLRCSYQHVEEKIAKKIKRGDASWNSAEERWECRHHEGQSALSIQEALPVVKSSFGYVLADGHHDLLSSVALGAKQIPVRVIGDLSTLSENAFWEAMEERGFAYLYDTQGNRKIPPKSFDLLQDDPNRLFAAISARKCLHEGDMEHSTGAEFPVWIKVGKGIPFIEFMIADVPWRHQLVYSGVLDEAFVEEARRVLAEENIPGLLLVPERRHYSEL